MTSLTVALARPPFACPGSCRANTARIPQRQERRPQSARPLSVSNSSRCSSRMHGGITRRKQEVDLRPQTRGFQLEANLFGADIDFATARFEDRGERPAATAVRRDRRTCALGGERNQRVLVPAEPRAIALPLHE